MSLPVRHDLGFDAIPPADEVSRSLACRRLDSLTKPHGALGSLEPLAAQVCAVQRTLQPAISDPTAIVFAADRGVSAYPRAVTEQMVKNFLGGAAAISVLALTSRSASRRPVGTRLSGSGVRCPPPARPGRAQRRPSLAYAARRRGSSAPLPR
jgi:hypothetical protein